jgi:sulfite reductase (NADPH) flavoprotein alpha-component
MATLVANNSETAVSRVPLQPGINTLGRAAGNHHVIPHHSISSRHCEIIVDEGTIALRDLGSTNGTFVDDQLVQKANLLNGQRLRLGSV